MIIFIDDPMPDGAFDVKNGDVFFSLAKSLSSHRRATIDIILGIKNSVMIIWRFVIFVNGEFFNYFIKITIKPTEKYVKPTPPWEKV